MADLINKAPKIQLVDFVNSLPDLKAGRIELLGGFLHHMENDRKIVLATEADFKKHFEEFKTLPV